jgi:adenine-specific DNA-methyltransferase
MKLPIFAEYDTFYITRYMGSKYRLLELILPQIEASVSGNGVVVDLMAGTHSVGYALKRRHRIVANDIQAYSEIFGGALLLNTCYASVTDRFETDLGELKVSVESEGWFSREYSDTYFSHGQCREIEEIRYRISKLSGDSDLANIYLSALCYAMGLCQSSPGHYAQFMPSNHSRIKKLRSKSVVEHFKEKCRTLKIQTKSQSCTVLRRDSLELLSSTELRDLAPPGSVVYLDPPYTTAQYSRYYHLMETVVLGDTPTTEFKGKYRSDRHQSAFCATTRVEEVFRKVINTASECKWNLVVSYSSHGLMKIRDLERLLRESYRDVLIASQSYSHSMQGRGQVDNRLEFVLRATSPAVGS